MLALLYPCVHAFAMAQWWCVCHLCQSDTSVNNSLQLAKYPKNSDLLHCKKSDISYIYMTRKCIWHTQLQIPWYVLQTTCTGNTIWAYTLTITLERWHALIISNIRRHRATMHHYCHAGEVACPDHFRHQETPCDHAPLLPCWVGGMSWSFPTSGDTARPCTITTMLGRWHVLIISDIGRHHATMHHNCHAGEVACPNHFEQYETWHDHIMHALLHGIHIWHCT